MQKSFRILSVFNEEAIRICRNSQNFRLFRYALNRLQVTGIEWAYRGVRDNLHDPRCPT